MEYFNGNIKHQASSIKHQALLLILFLLPNIVLANPPALANPNENAAVVISELNLPEHIYDRVVSNHYFYSPALVYSGSPTSTFVNVNSGGWYLRVKACNAAGCSGYSNQVYAAYANYCQ